eukprot:snap_masked-scaffold18_size714446-processed-gene-6.21 protein:Tk08497 transcript:snap_masked-scaffold18_size714446-processed-gene-6.21-mRNA-1 annotation:"mixed-lineage leukemia"
MVGGCCVCSDERGWDENPLVYCDGTGCNVAVHQACYGIVAVPTGPWFCRKCESQERSARVRCELCPSREGALKRTDTNSWAHVVCALYIPEVRFGNVSTMEPIVLGLIPQERFLKVCYLCEKQGRESKAATGACMQCNRPGCKQSFHVTCAQSAGYLCEEAGNYMDNVKYCGYCEYHYQRIVSANKKIVKTIPAFKPVKHPIREGQSPDSSPEKALKDMKAPNSTIVGSSSFPSTSVGIPPSSSSSSNNSVAENNGSNNSISISSNVASSSSGVAGSGTLVTAAYKKGKKGRKAVGNSGSSSSSEVKLEAAKFVLDSSSNHDEEDSKGSSNDVHPSVRSTLDEDSNHSKDSVVRPPTNVSSRNENKESSSSSRSEERPSSGSSAQEKQPVILKFGKQDNGQYYKKDVSNSSSSSKKDKERDRSRGKDKKHSSSSSSSYHHEKSSSTPISRQQSGEERAEADSSGRVTPTNLSYHRSNSMDGSSRYHNERLSRKQSESSPSRAHNANHHEGSSEAKEASMKVEAMEVDVETSRASSSELALSAIKTTSCSVTLDKSKVDMKLLAKGANVSASGGLNGSLLTRASHKSEAHFHTLSARVGLDGGDKDVTSTKVEADSSKKDANSSVIEAIKKRGSDVYAMMPDEDDVKLEPLTPKSSENSISGVTMTSLSSSDVGQKSSEASSSVTSTGTSGPGGVTIEQVSPIKKEDNSPPLGKIPRMSASGKRIGRPPKKGLHVATNSMSQLTSSSGSGPISQRSSSPDAEGNIKRKRKSPHKKPVNGTDNPSWMLGATLNMNSPMSKEMNLALLDEMKTHSVYDGPKDKQYVGVPFLGRKRTPSSQSHSASDMLNPGKSQPQTLEELLERQWEQGSQFLMEQASHFDIASLLSSLHQLKEENVELEDSVDKLVQRRDHLLAVRARLLALTSLSTNSASTTPEKTPPTRTPAHQNGPSHSGASRSEGSTPHVSPRNHTSSATVSPVSIQRAQNSMMVSGGSSLPPPSASPRLQQQQHLPPPSASPRDHHRSSVPPPQQLPSPRDARISPRGPSMENGLDYHHSGGQQHHMPPGHYQQHRGPPGGRGDGQPSGPPPTSSHGMGDRMPPMSQAHLLAVATTASRMTTHPTPPPRQSAYPPQGPPPGSSQHNSRSMPPHGMPPHPSMMRGAASSSHGPMGGHHYGGNGPPPGAGSGYQMISPPPSHSGPPPSSMVTLDRSSQQQQQSMRNPPTSHHPSMRLDKR